VRRAARQLAWIAWTLIAALCLAGCGPGRARPPEIDGALDVRAPESAPAGDALPVSVGGADLPDGAVVVLAVLTSEGLHLLQSAAADGRAIFVVPGAMTRAAGVAALTASIGRARGHAAVQLTASGPISPITPLIGPHSVIANGRAQSMAVVIPFDEHGNTIADGSTVRLSIQYPDQRVVEREVTLQGGVAWLRVPGGMREGRIAISAVSGAGRGQEADLVAVSGDAADLRVMIEPAVANADGRQIVSMRTTQIRDAAGNLVSDGTLVRFIAKMPDGTLRSIPASAIDGVAQAPLQAPAAPGIAEIVVLVLSQQSQPAQITFTPGPAIGAIAVSAEIDPAKHKLRVTAGPIAGALGQLVPDGTVVEMTITDAAGATHLSSAQTELGMIDTLIELHGLAPGPAQLALVVGAGQGETTLVVPQE
jgi:hypothetical protein